MSDSPAVILYDSNGVEMSVQDGVAIPANTSRILIAGADGTTARSLAVDSIGRAGIQNPPNLDAGLSTRASLANQTNGAQKSQVVDGGNVLEVNVSGQAAIQNPPNLDVAASTLATEAKLEAVRVLLATIDADTSNLDVALSTRASETKLEAVRLLLASLDAKDYATQTTLAAILVDTGQVEALLGTIDADTSVLAAVDYATQTTLAAVLVDTGQIEALLTTIDADTSNLDVLLSTRATEATLLAADGRLTTIDAVLDSIKDVDGIKKITDALPVGGNLIGRTILRDPTDSFDVGDVTNPLRTDPKGNNGGSGTIAALNAFVEVSAYGSSMIAAQVTGTWVGTLVGEASIDGTTWISITGFQIGGSGVVTATTENGNFRANTNGFQKMRVRASAWTNGTATIDINTTVRTGQIPVDGNGNIGVRVVATAPPAGIDGTVIAADTPLTVGTHVTSYVIPNGETFFLQQLLGGNEDPSKGASVEVIYYDGTTEHLVHRDYYNGATHAASFPDVSAARDGTAMIGDGSTKLIRVRRAKFSGSDIAIDAVVYGYTQ